ncbi:MAG TPA: tRNA (adenosine(37)-N6)-threonylcarbamoyltransferase complex transferase subunit TsaD, partial [Candidatus Saccharimonadia bacterium]
MNILGIETSCDETAAAVVKDGRIILSNVVASQGDLHAQFGGVVPEIAARSHIEMILPIVKKALDEAETDWNAIDAIAVTRGPGLIGSLLIGILAAQTLATLKNMPLIPINHIEAHTYANFLLPAPLSFPLLSLTVSGSHTQLVLFTDHGQYRVLGKTLDDAAGEAFDKVARMIGLSRSSGAAIEVAAAHGNNQAFAFPKPKLGKESFNFSFSGLKTAVLRTAQAAVGRDHRTLSHELPALLRDSQRNDLAASFQKTVVEILAGRLLQAYEAHSPSSVVIGGGVAANQALRSKVATLLPVTVGYPPLDLCTDNAAMVASLGYFQLQSGR